MTLLHCFYCTIGQSVPVISLQETSTHITCRPVPDILTGWGGGIVLYWQCPASVLLQAEVTHERCVDAIYRYRHSGVVVVGFKGMNPRLPERASIAVQDMAADTTCGMRKGLVVCHEADHISSDSGFGNPLGDIFFKCDQKR